MHIKGALILEQTLRSFTFLMCLYDISIFFFQAEDGIRAGHVTGVQTCALPISAGRSVFSMIVRQATAVSAASAGRTTRSEERRVGKECRSRRARYHYKKYH